MTEVEIIAKAFYNYFKDTNTLLSTIVDENLVTHVLWSDDILSYIEVISDKCKQLENKIIDLESSFEKERNDLKQKIIKRYNEEVEDLIAYADDINPVSYYANDQIAKKLMEENI